MMMSPLFLIAIGATVTLAMLYFAMAGPSADKARARRLSELRERHGGANVAVEAQMRKIISNRPIASGNPFARFIPNPKVLTKRLQMTGKNWTAGRYGLASLGIGALVAISLLVKGAPILLAIFLGLALGLFIPHFAVGYMINRRAAQFNARFPDAIELMVRGLRSGLPISETLNIISGEISGPVGEEFRMVSDKIKIGRTMDEALQLAADRLGTAEFQFFVISLAIQRETGGNLAETLSNLADVLRKRGQMKLKIRAMSSESKASAYIVGSLPFVVFGLVWMVNPGYLEGFFYEERLMIAGGGGLVWMGIGVFIMAKMVNFEI